MASHEPTNPRPGHAKASEPFLLRLGEEALTLDELDAALGQRIQIELSDAVLTKIASNCEAARRFASADEPVYGINTGFGHLCKRRIDSADLAKLQKNLILSHAVGVGPLAPDDLVRWMMLFKIQDFTHARSGVSLQTVRCLAAMLSADVLPLIPTKGSLGASGDLAPLAHMVLPMIGKGQVRHAGQVRPSSEVFAQLGIEPAELGPKEGLALINGTQFMSAYAAQLVIRSRRLMKHADVIATLSLEGLAGSIKPFDDRLNRSRPHRGALESAQNVRRMMTDSEVLQSHAHCDRVQDPYSLRCVPQVHGASRDAIRHAAGVVETEINSVTDNPLIFEDEVISGGLFHGQPLALVLDYLAMALAELASISERRTYLLLSGPDGLPELLMKDTGLNSGFMLPQYTAAALVSENKGLCMPASVDSIPTSLGQEDHVSMGARAATKCLEILENTETVLAIEQMCAAQAMDYRAPLKPGAGPRIAHERIRAAIPHAEQDRMFGEDIQTSLRLLRSQSIVQAVEKKLGALS